MIVVFLGPPFILVACSGSQKRVGLSDAPITPLP